MHGDGRNGTAADVREDARLADDQLLRRGTGIGTYAALAGVSHFVKVQSDLMSKFPETAQNPL